MKYTQNNHPELEDVEIIHDDLLHFIKTFRNNYDSLIWAMYYDAMNCCIDEYSINLMYNLKKNYAS